MYQKKIFCLMLACLMLIGMLDFSTVFAIDETDTILQDNIQDTVPTTELTNIDAETTKTVLINNEESVVINTKEFRNLEVYVTDGYSPVTGAVVQISDMTAISDENGIAYFEQIPANDEENCQLTISSDIYGERKNDVVIPYTMNVDNGDAIRFTISYWTPEMTDSAAIALDEDTESEITAFAADSWRYISGIPSGTYSINEYNGLIYCLGESENKVYNPSTGIWAQLSGGVGVAMGAYYNSDPIFCNGKIYHYSATYSADGEDSYGNEYYKSSGYMFCYDLNTGSQSQVLYSEYGGRYYDSAIECGGKIYFAGGERIEEDTGSTMENYSVDVFNTTKNSIGFAGDLYYSNNIEKAVLYNNGTYDNIYYFTDRSVEKLDIATETLESCGTDDERIIFAGESACASNGCVYFVGGDGALNTLRTYDFDTNKWLPDILMPNARKNAIVQYYGGKIYILGGYDDSSEEYMTGLDIYDTINGTWTSENCALNTVDGQSLVYNGKMYAVSADTLGIYSLKKSSNNIYIPQKVNYDYFITAIDSYRNQTLAIDENGNVISWGEGYYADDSSSMTVKPYPTVIDPFFMNNPVQISRGKNHNLVLDANGAVWGWGSNSNYPMGGYSGKLETNTELNCISDVDQIAAGTEFSIFLKDGKLFGIGKNDVGQLGQESIETSAYSVPVQITAKQDFQKVSVGEDYVIALASDGVYTWGNNTKGQLGNGTSQNMNAVPQKITFNLSAREYIVDVESGIYFGMALTSQGNVYAWGDNGSGELGQNNKGVYLIPTKVKNITDITAIAAGKTHALAVKNNGEAVYGWGYGRDGQLGFSATGSVLLPREITALSDKGIKDISCGNDFSVALSVDGSVYTFGNNEYGQLGVYYADTTEVSSPIINDVKWLNNYMSNYKEVTSDIPLPNKGENGSNISWESSYINRIDVTGKVKRPNALNDNANVTLTATIKYNNSVTKIDYRVVVMKSDELSELINAVDISDDYLIQDVIEKIDSEHAYKFIPKTSNTYIFTTVSNMDTVGYFYDSKGNQIDYNDDGNDYDDFRISQNLIAGNTYYIKIKGYSDETGSYSLYIETPLEITFR